MIGLTGNLIPFSLLKCINLKTNVHKTMSIFLPFLFLDGRWDSWHTGAPKAPTHLREQQHGAQYRQHPKHPLLQQQHSLAQRVTQQDGKLRHNKASHGLVCSSPSKTSFLGFKRWKKYGNNVGKSIWSHHFCSSLARKKPVSCWTGKQITLQHTSLKMNKTTTMWT